MATRSTVEPLGSSLSSDSSITDIAERARQLLLCCRNIDAEHPRKVATAQLARFNLWASNIGVFAPRHASLDYRLRTAPIVRVTIDGNLEILCRHLLCTLKATTDLSEAEINGFYDIRLSQTYHLGLKLLTESRPDDALRIRELNLAKETIGSLHQISLAIRKASNRNILTKVPSLFDVDDHYTIIREYSENIPSTVVESNRFEITSRFEDFVRKVLMTKWLLTDKGVELDSQQTTYRQTLLDRCVELVTVRRRQLAYFRNHQSKLAAREQKVVPTTAQRTEDRRIEKHSNDPGMPPIAPEARLAEPVLLVNSQAALSETVGSELQLAQFRLAPPTSAPSSTNSSTNDGGFMNSRLYEVPPAPKLEAGETEKSCPYCCLVLPAKTFQVQKKGKRWQKHLLDDLKPYICLFANCGQRGKSYSSFKEWEVHLNQPHVQSWGCPLHPQASQSTVEESLVFDKLASFEAHLSTCHADFESATSDDLIQQASQLAVLPQWCFVCFEVLPSIPSLQKHVANHLKSMSLLALPWRDDIESEGLASDRPMTDTRPSNASDQSQTNITAPSRQESITSDETRKFASRLLDINSTQIPIHDRLMELETWVIGPTVPEQPPEEPPGRPKQKAPKEEAPNTFRQKNWHPSIQRFSRYVKLSCELEILDPWLPEMNTPEKTRPFMPADRIEEYLEKKDCEEFKSIMSELFPTSDPIDPREILLKYTSVFCILLYIGRGDNIKNFLHHDSLNDMALPFDPASPPAYLSGDFADQNFWSDFCNAQWRFCVPTFEDGVSDRYFESDRVLPIIYKKKLAGGPTASLWLIKIHPSHNKLISANTKIRLKEQANTFVLKEYSIPEAEGYYNNEIAAFSKIGKNRDIIEYYGSFRRGGTFNVLLEYADQGNLKDFFQKQEPPTNGGAIIQFWEGLFKLIDALRTVHSVEGWHQDVQPNNILVVSNGSKLPHEWQFKLADLGISNFKAISTTSRENSTASVSYGIRTYDAPECFRPDLVSGHTKLKVHQTIDIWSLGCVFSEAVRWLPPTQKYPGILAYCEERKAEIDKIPAFHGGDCFHNGLAVLDAVSKSHETAIGDLYRKDHVTERVVGMIEDMLVEPEARPSTHYLWLKQLRILDAARKKLASSISTDSVPDIATLPVASSVSPATLGNDSTISSYALPIQNVTVTELPLYPYMSVQDALDWKQRCKVNGSDESDLAILLQHTMRGRHHVFLIDDSVTMIRHWEIVCKVFEAMSYIAKDTSKDGLDLYFTISETCQKNAKKTSQLVTTVYHQKQRRTSTTDINFRLGTILDEYKSQLDSQNTWYRSAPRPLSLYIFTDGLWEDGCTAVEPIKNAVLKLEDLRMNDQQIGIQFISFGSDPKGLTRLDYLDEGMNLSRAIVDTEHSSGNVCKMFLGSIVKTLDSQDQQLSILRAYRGNKKNSVVDSLGIVIGTRLGGDETGPNMR